MVQRWSLNTDKAIFSHEMQSKLTPSYKEWTNEKGFRISFVQAGRTSQPALVFFPGWCGSIAFWNAQIEHFSKEYNVIAIDYPGFGNAQLPADQKITMAEQATIINQILDESQVKACTLVGHSIGGALALAVAEQNSQRVDAVIGADAFVYLDAYPRVPENQITDIIGGLRSDFTGALRAITDGYFLENADANTKQFVVDTMLESDPDAARMILEEFLRWDMDIALRGYDGVLGVIASDAFYNESEFVSRYGDRFDVRSVKDAGHFVMLDASKAFNTALEKFLIRTGSKS